MNGRLKIGALAFLAFAGCAEPRSGGEPLQPVLNSVTLTEEAAREAIEHSVRFESHEQIVHLLEWQSNSKDAAQLIRIHKSQGAAGLLVEVEILPEGEPYIRSAEYFSGGIIPLTLVHPLVRRVVEINSIRDTDQEGMKEVSFAWDWKDVPEVLGRMKPELADGPRPGKAWVQLQDNQWHVIGNVRDFHTSL